MKLNNQGFLTTIKQNTYKNPLTNSVSPLISSGAHHLCQNLQHQTPRQLLQRLRPQLHFLLLEHQALHLIWLFCTLNSTSFFANSAVFWAASALARAVAAANITLAVEERLDFFDVVDLTSYPSFSIFKLIECAFMLTWCHCVCRAGLDTACNNAVFIVVAGCPFSPYWPRRTTFYYPGVKHLLTKVTDARVGLDFALYGRCETVTTKYSVYECQIKIIT